MRSFCEVLLRAAQRETSFRNLCLMRVPGDTPVLLLEAAVKGSGQEGEWDAENDAQFQNRTSGDGDCRYDRVRPPGVNCGLGADGLEYRRCGDGETGQKGLQRREGHGGWERNCNV